MKKLAGFTILYASLSASLGISLSAQAQNLGVDQFTSVKNTDGTKQLVGVTSFKSVGMTSAFDSTNKQTKRGLYLSNNSLTSLNFSNSDKLEYGVHFNLETPQDYIDLNRNDYIRDNFKTPKIANSTLTTGAYLNYRLTPNYALTSSLNYSNGNERGAQLSVGAKATSIFNKKHRLTTVFSVNWGNQNYVGGNLWNQIDNKYIQNTNSLNLSNYTPRTELRLGTSWNWNIDPSWSLSTGVSARHMLGDSSKNLFLQQRTPVTIFSVITYRF
ncbi:MipA/OmpV family protein [Undibacterium danionis]|uniref:MipA/OmpV family protein n=1 Tax=Undibacterium danionis TaxID=1812100 RepID=A0ABV6IGD3_9BURK